VKQAFANKNVARLHAMWVRMAVCTSRALIWTVKYPAAGQERNF
jgi:hypothetical protein